MPAGRTAGTRRVSRAQPAGLLRRLLDRADRVDWRYKLQLTIGVCLAITIPFYLLRDHLMALGKWGYLGAFLINGLSSATVVLPAPGGLLIAMMGRDFNPLLVGVAAGLGGTLGGSTAYLAGAVNGRAARESRWFRWLDGLMTRAGGAIIFFSGLLPLFPGDFATVIAGAVRYPFKKYLWYNGLASVIKMGAIAYVGADVLSRLERLATQWVTSLFQ